MHVSFLRVFQLRRWQTVEITPSAGLNVFAGNNGSGKTSLLEALYIAHCGRSFRSRHFDELVSKDKAEFEVKVTLAQTQEGSKSQTIAVRKNRAITVSKVDGDVISSASVMARLLPLLLIDTSSFLVIEGGPRLRRGFIDKLLFHVKPEFLKLSQRYNVALEQRNKILRSKRKTAELEFWTQQLADDGSAIDDLRKKSVQELNETLVDIPLVAHTLGKTKLLYRQGWKEELSLRAAFDASYASDMDQGSTTVGPHKAELAITAGNSKVARFASRGQTKAVVIGMTIAIANRIKDAISSPPIILIDDFSAELDAQTTREALSAISNTCTQVFITTLDPNLIPGDMFLESKTFHVKPEETLYG